MHDQKLIGLCMTLTGANEGLACSVLVHLDLLRRRACQRLADSNITSRVRLESAADKDRPDECPNA